MRLSVSIMGVHKPDDDSKELENIKAFFPKFIVEFVII